MTLARAIGLGLLGIGVTQGLAAQDGPAATKFTIKVENISKGEVLKLSNGKSAPFVSAPVLWVVHTGSSPIFTGGQLDEGKGLGEARRDGESVAAS